MADVESTDRKDGPGGGDAVQGQGAAQPGGEDRLDGAAPAPLDAAAETRPEEVGADADPVETGATTENTETAVPPAADPEPDTAASGALGDPNKDWYIIHTYSGFENKVLQSLRQRADAYGMGEKIGEILVPTEDVAEMRDGKKVVTKKKIFPGYVLVNMEMSDEAWHVVRSTPKVTGFLGSGQKPLPMPQVEVDRILNQVHVAKEKPKPKFDYSVGETVKITDGPFNNFSGVVEEVNDDRATLKVMVSIFGRATPVELEFHQVKRPD